MAKANELVVPVELLHCRIVSGGDLTPGMHGIVLRIGDAVDRLQLAADVDRSVWLQFAAAELRGARDDNHRLLKWLGALHGLVLMGERGGTRGSQLWSAVLVSGVRVDADGARVEVEVPTDTVNLLRRRTGAAFVKLAELEAKALWRVQGATRELYLALARLRWMEVTEWTFGLAELRAKLGVGDKRAYARFNNFHQRVLAPALERINLLAPVEVAMEPIRVGRTVGHVRFTWRWKSAAEAVAADAENARHSVAQGKPRDARPEAPPLTVPRFEDAELVREAVGAQEAPSPKRSPIAEATAFLRGARRPH